MGPGRQLWFCDSNQCQPGLTSVRVVSCLCSLLGHNFNFPFHFLWTLKLFALQVSCRSWWHTSGPSSSNNFVFLLLSESLIKIYVFVAFIVLNLCDLPELRITVPHSWFIGSLSYYFLTSLHSKSRFSCQLVTVRMLWGIAPYNTFILLCFVLTFLPFMSVFHSDMLACFLSVWTNFSEPSSLLWAQMPVCAHSRAACICRT